MKGLFTVVKKGMTKLLAAIATILLSVMTLLVLYQVFTRYVLNSPAAFTEELVRYFLIWTGFIGAAYAFITREHMCLVLVRDSLKPEKKRILMTFIDVLILVFAISVPSFCFSFLVLYRTGDLFARSGPDRRPFSHFPSVFSHLQMVLHILY